MIHASSLSPHQRLFELVRQRDHAQSIVARDVQAAAEEEALFEHLRTVASASLKTRPVPRIDAPKKRAPFLARLADHLRLSHAASDGREGFNLSRATLR